MGADRMLFGTEVKGDPKGVRRIGALASTGAQTPDRMTRPDAEKTRGHHMMFLVTGLCIDI